MDHRDLAAHTRENDRRIATERSIARGLIRHLKAAGWRAEFNGSRYTESQLLDRIFAVDMVRVYFANADGRRHWVLLVGGNDQDILTDWSFSDGDPDGFNAAMDSYCDALNVRFGT